MASLKPREKRTLMVGGAVFLVLLLLWYFFIWENSPLSRLREAQDRLVRREEVLRKMLNLRRKYVLLQGKINEILAQMQGREGGDSPKGFLERIVREKAPSAELERMKARTNPVHDLYRETEVEVKLGRMVIPELVDVLYGVEAEGNALKVKELSIELARKSPDFLDVEFTVISAEPLDNMNREITEGKQ